MVSNLASMQWMQIRMFSIAFIHIVLVTSTNTSASDVTNSFP